MVKRFELQRMFNNDREVEISLTGALGQEIAHNPCCNE
jgi:hypothetical protein